MYLKINNKILLLLLILCYYSSYAQEYSDLEIGFGKEAAVKEIRSSNPTISDESLKSSLAFIRDEFLNRFKFGKDAYIEKDRPHINVQIDSLTQRFSGCENFTFSGLNPFINWDLLYNENPFGNDLIAEFNVIGQTHLDDEIGGFRFQALQNNYNDQFLGTIPNSVMRIGNGGDGRRREMIRRTFVINSVDDFIVYNFAIVLEAPGHDGGGFFSVLLRRENGQVIECTRVNYEGGSSNSGFVQFQQSDVYFKPWATNIIKPVDFGIQVGETITIEVMAADCILGGHFGYGYFDIKCLNEDQIIKVDGNQCLESTVNFSTNLDSNNNIFNWSIEDQNGTAIELQNNSQAQLSYIFNQSGTYTVILKVKYFTTTEQCEVFSSFKKIITIVEDCEDCIDCTSFALIKNEKYLISGWIKESEVDFDNEQLKNFEKSSITVSFFDVGGSLIGQPNNFFTSGDIIEGWQRIVGEFTVPQNIDNLKIDLNNLDTSRISYFDDIRVLPSKGSMKSFVYDKITQRLMAELDENNYGTFYEYDQEGGLIRVKKETERGIYTIQETRSSNVKSVN